MLILTAYKKMKSFNDQIVSMMFKNGTTRANIAQLDYSWRQILFNHNNLPREASNILGQLTVASILLSSTIKHKGSVALQVYGEGAIKLAFAECNHDFTFKSTIKLRKNIQNLDNLTFKEMVNGEKKGVFSVIIDQKIKNHSPYQGIIPLDGENLNEIVKNYLENSEQIDSELILTSSSKAAAGLLIQKMPSTEDEADLEWKKLKEMIKKIPINFLNQKNIHTIVSHFFGKFKHKILKNKTPVFSCHCDAERAIKMLKMLGENEIKELSSSEKKIDVTCEFCGRLFSFDKDKCYRLFN